MADVEETDGVQTIDDDSRTSPELPLVDTHVPIGKHASTTSITTSLSKSFSIDHDGDGAPTSSDTSTKHQKIDQYSVDGRELRERIVSFDSSAESTPRKSVKKPKPIMSTSQILPRGGPDLSTLDMKTSWDGSVPSGSSNKGGILADPAKIAKEREKEERVRQARERLLEERQKKLDELREQQKMAQENREKQLEMRKKKIEDLRKRDVERRSAVEERRKMKEEVERAHRKSILQKAEERVARYEAWKAGGRKGGRGHVLGFGSATPRDICQPLERPRRSSSQSALQTRSPNGSDMDSVRPQRRALSACSTVRRHVDSNRIGVFNGGDSPPKLLSVSTSVLYSKSSQEYSSSSTLLSSSRLSSAVGAMSATTSAPTATHYYPRPTIPSQGISPLSWSSMTTSLPSPVMIRDKAGRKPRPASVASSTPSFVGGEPAKSHRSKSTDRTGRDRSRTRSSRKDETAGKNKEENKAQKTEQAEDSQEKMKETTGVKEHAEKKDRKERVSLSFAHRLSAPKTSRKDQEQGTKEPAAKKDGPIIRIQFFDEAGLDGDIEPEQQLVPRKAYSTSDLAMRKKRSSLREKQSPTHTKDAGTKVVQSKDVHRGTTPTGGGPTPTIPVAIIRAVSPVGKESDKSTIRVASPRSTTPTSFITPSATSTPIVPTLSSSAVVSNANTTPTQSLATPSQHLVTPTADDGTTVARVSGGPAQDISADEYKARLAEKRRQARERAEREAEEERKRQEEARLAEEERQRKEEQEEKEFEEESLHLAEEARKLEEERLQKAIEAEEKRKKEEAVKLEQERKAKEDAERKMKAETERLEKEKQEKARKDDEERLERKKKLEMIMKRVKADTESQPKMETSVKSTNMFASVTHFSSSQSSPDEELEKSVVTSDISDEEGTGIAVAEGSAVEVYSAAMTTSFMQDLEEVDMTASTSSSTSTVTRSLSSGDILDGPSSHSGVNERLSQSAGTTPSKPDERTIAFEKDQILDKDVLRRSFEAIEKRKQDAEKQEQEKRKKEDIERRSKTEINHVDMDKYERARRDDEERLERKKKLEMIMKRVKADTESQPKMETSVKSTNMFASVTHFSSSQSSPDEELEKSVVTSDISDEEGTGIAVAEGSAVEVYSAAMTTSFMQDLEEVDMTASTSSSTSTVTRSLSSGDILDGPSSHSGVNERLSHSAGTTPSKPDEKTISTETKSKFKSPLLQELVENKGGISGSPRFKSPLLQSLLSKTKVGAQLGLSVSMGDLSSSKETSSSPSQSRKEANTYMTLSTSSIGINGSSQEAGKQEQSDTSEFEQVPKSFDRYMFTNGIGRDSGDVLMPTSSSKSSFDSSPFEGSKLFPPLMSDSALGSSIEPVGDGLMSQSVFVNGHGDYTNRGMEDSSIGLFSTDEGGSKSTPHTPFETLEESERPEDVLSTTQDDDGQFEDDLIDFGGAPIRAFEESNRRSDVTDYLS